MHASRKGLKDPAKRAINEKRLSSTRRAPITRRLGQLKPLASKARRGVRHETDIIRHVKFVKSDAPPCERLLSKIRARGNHQGRDEQPLHEISGAQRPIKMRRIAEGNDNDGMDANGIICTTRIVTRRTFTEELHMKVIAQKSNSGTMHANMNSENANSKAPMHGVYNDRGLGSDQSTHMGSTSSCRYGRTKLENDAIGRILRCKPY